MPKILIIDDDECVATCLSTILQGAGYTCRVACSTHRAHELLWSDSDISVVLLDQNLGECSESGLTFLIELRQTPGCENLPVIVCTGDARPNLLRSFIGQRVSGFIRKPFRVNRLLSEIEAALNPRQPAGARASAPAAA